MRHRLILPLSVLVAAAFVVGSCGEQEPLAPEVGTLSTLADDAGGVSAKSGGPVVFSARGSGHATGPTLGGVEAGWRNFTFNAIQRQDRTTTGHMRYDTHDQGDPAVTHRQHGRVFCMARVDNSDIVIVGAEGTLRSPEDNPSNPLGLPQPNRPGGNHGIFFAVRDNGEGANASRPDQFTGAVHTLEQVVGAVCADPEILSPGPGIPASAVAESFFNDVEAGNIQVTFP